MRDVPLPNPVAVAARWHGAPASVAHLRDGANSVYRFDAGGVPLVLRLTRSRRRSRGQLEAELEFIEFVSSRGVAAARPVPSVAGALIESIDSGGAADAWHAVVFTLVPGRHFEFYTSDVDRPLIHAWGRAMGTLHAASRDFTPAAERRPPWSEQDGVRCDAARLPQEETAARHEYARIAEWLGSLRTTNENWGLIHGDFERTNFTIDGATLHVYDFDDACYHWYLADIAHALWVFRGAPARDRARFLEWFLEGYRERSALDLDAAEHFSWFIRSRSLSLFIHRLETGAASVSSAADERWLRRMRAELEEQYRW